MLQKQGDEKVLHQYAQLTNHAGYLKAKGIELEKELEQAKNRVLQAKVEMELAEQLLKLAVFRKKRHDREWLANSREVAKYCQLVRKEMGLQAE